MSSTLRGALLSLAAFGFYATHDVVVKLLGETYTSFQIMFFSGLMGFPLVMMMLMGDRRESTLIPRHPWWSALRSVAVQFFANGMVYATASRSSSASSGSSSCCAPAAETRSRSVTWPRSGRRSRVP